MKKLLAVIVTAAFLAACGARTSKVVVGADTSTVNKLLVFKAAKDERCDAGQIPATACKVVAQAFVPVWDAYLTANSLITAGAPLDKVDAAVAEFKAAVVKFRDVVDGIEAESKQLLLDILAEALLSFENR